VLTTPELRGLASGIGLDDRTGLGSGADLAEPLSQGPVTGGKDVDHQRAGLPRGFPERRGRVDQAEQAGRLALDTRTEETVRPAPPRGCPAVPDGDRRHQPPAQPAGRVTPLGRDGNGRLHLDADGFLPGRYASIVPPSLLVSTACSKPASYPMPDMGWNEAITATASTSMSRSSRISRRTSTTVLAGGCWMFTYRSRTSRTTGSWVASTR
jgi:hypothetical protein